MSFLLLSLVLHFLYPSYRIILYTKNRKFFYYELILDLIINDDILNRASNILISILENGREMWTLVWVMLSLMAKFIQKIQKRMFGHVIRKSKLLYIAYIRYHQQCHIPNIGSVRLMWILSILLWYSCVYTIYEI